jgi:hypothetical protein
MKTSSTVISCLGASKTQGGLFSSICIIYPELLTNLFVYKLSEINLPLYALHSRGYRRGMRRMLGGGGRA